jgi:RHS repeat-associated protein
MKKVCIITLLVFAVSALAARAGIACGGRIQKTGSTYEIQYFITDHLGSTRVITDSNGEIKEQNDYYPFGMRHANPDLMTSTNRYLFSGKELQTTGGINYMDFGSRMYDDFLGRWFTHDPQSYRRPWESPYGYCGGNPVSRIDPDGEFFWLIINYAKDFVVNTFVKSWTQGFNAWTDKKNWHSTTMAWKIDMGWFKGKPLQILSRFTWEYPQTLIGYQSSQFHNLFNGVKSVSYYGGATVVESYSSGWRAFTLGSYINGQRGIQADPNNWLFQHEYGHYLQSQSSGWFYLPKYAIPSFIDAATSSDHDHHAVEQNANVRAYMYFKKHVTDFNVPDAAGNYINGKWHELDNPIKGYNWSLSYDDPSNVFALLKGLMYLMWYPY